LSLDLTVALAESRRTCSDTGGTSEGVPE